MSRILDGRLSSAKHREFEALLPVPLDRRGRKLGFSTPLPVWGLTGGENAAKSGEITLLSVAAAVRREGAASRRVPSGGRMVPSGGIMMALKAQQEKERRGQMTREVALAHAEREGLTLVRSVTNKTGFKNLQFYKGDPPHPYQLKIRKDGHTSHIGSYTVPEEGALEYARIIGPEASAREAAEATPAMTREEALDAAEQEGQTLLRARNTTGFKYVVHHKNHGPRPFGLRITQDGQLLHLGTFATAEEAALQYARQYGRREDPRLGRARHTERAATLVPRHRERTVLTAAAAAAAARREERFRCRRAELQDLQDLLTDRLLSEESYTAEVKRVLEKEAPEHRAPDTGLSLLASLAIPMRLEEDEPEAEALTSRKRKAPATAAAAAAATAAAAAAAAESTTRSSAVVDPDASGAGAGRGLSDAALSHVQPVAAHPGHRPYPAAHLQAGQLSMPPIQPFQVLRQQCVQSLQRSPPQPSGHPMPRNTVSKARNHKNLVIEAPARSETVDSAQARNHKHLVIEAPARSKPVDIGHAPPYPLDQELVLGRSGPVGWRPGEDARDVQPFGCGNG